jgi:predicted anti-sigma-YlaC factor YlaD
MTSQARQRSRWVGAAVRRECMAMMVLLALLVPGCSVKRYAINTLGDSLAQGTSTFASDDDIQLIGDALPFSLKLIESLLAESPNHRGLLVAAASGFTQYAYLYVQQPADEIESIDITRCLEMRSRARRLYIRARNYGLRGLEVAHPGLEKTLRETPDVAARKLVESDVPLAYWTAAAWASAISLGKDNPELIADQRIVEALIDRAAALDERFQAGAIHSFLIAYEPARQGGKGDPLARARSHFERAVELSGENLAGPYVTYAETVSVSKQDRAEFESMLRRALAIDVDEKPEWRLANIAYQRRARWLLAHIDDLFLPVNQE